MDWLKLFAPAISTFIGGPVGLIAEAGVQFLADKLGAKAQTVAAIKSTLAGYTPEDRIKLRELDIDFQKFCLENGIQIQLAQIGVDQAEAGSRFLFVAGWRPAVGWTCAAALAYAAVIEPIARFAATVLYHYQGPFPRIDTTLTMQVLFGLLGLGAYRTVEKIRGASDSH